jgi:branched-subunit amino acid aminotransferase/4-amino-4-deoxychorismate lyase
LEEEVSQVAVAMGVSARIRITLTRGGRRIIMAWPADPSRRHQGVTAVRRGQPREPHLGGRVKHGSRMPWAVAVARSGVDEVLLVDDADRFTEGTTCAILAVVDGVLWVAPDDGAVLASTTVDDLLARAARLGVPVRRERPDAHGPWDGLYIASSTRDLAPVLELDGERLSGWEEVGRRLAGLAEEDDAHRS